MVLFKFNKRDKKNRLFSLDDIVEKPEPKPFKSFAVGRYIFENEI